MTDSPTHTLSPSRQSFLKAQSAVTSHEIADRARETGLTPLHASLEVALDLIAIAAHIAAICLHGDRERDLIQTTALKIYKPLGACLEETMIALDPQRHHAGESP